MEISNFVIPTYFNRPIVWGDPIRIFPRHLVSENENDVAVRWGKFDVHDSWGLTAVACTALVLRQAVIEFSQIESRFGTTSTTIAPRSHSGACRDCIGLEYNHVF